MADTGAIHASVLAKVFADLAENKSQILMTCSLSQKLRRFVVPCHLDSRHSLKVFFFFFFH